VTARVSLEAARARNTATTCLNTGRALALGAWALGAVLIAGAVFAHAWDWTIFVAILITAGVSRLFYDAAVDAENRLASLTTREDD
jgi:hypothetical protein